MAQHYSYKIYDDSSQLPEHWDHLAACNIFLGRNYFRILEKSSPSNMVCHFIGLFADDCLVGIALSQFLDINQLESFGERDRCLKTTVRNFVFKNFSSHVLFIGNNMLTGQNAYFFSEAIDEKTAIGLLREAAEAIKQVFKNKGRKIHITTFKDFNANETQSFRAAGFQSYYKFSTQPNMVFDIPDHWKSEADYIAALSKKYRDQYKRARKKSEGIVKKKMNLQEITDAEDVLYDLYFHVAKNAPFNTFFLARNHFRVFKEILKDQFLFYGYFLDGKLIGFNTLIKNGKTIDTYFLGYDDAIQKEKMLYLNMLYDMIAYSVNKGFRKIVFARTALEIKSSVGARPVEMFGFIQHSNAFLNRQMARIFRYLEPEVVWKERNPFKDAT